MHNSCNERWFWGAQFAGMLPQPLRAFDNGAGPPGLIEESITPLECEIGFVSDAECGVALHFLTLRGWQADAADDIRAGRGQN